MTRPPEERLLTEANAADTYVTKASGTTAERPDPAVVGPSAMYYDTTLSVPVWSDGAAWLDATGTAA
jgi:hypothetical protein